MPTCSLRSVLLLGVASWVSNAATLKDPDSAAKPSDVAVTYHVISLEAFSRKPLSHYRATDSWSIPPRGRQIIGGVPFLIEGKAEVTGLGAARDGSFFPTRICGIPVGALGQTIHLLHGTGYADKDDTPMAEMVLNYQNGASRRLIISYGVHSRNWYEEAREASRPVSDPGSKVGWYGARQDTGFSPSLRLYTTAWRNPLPGELIETIDFYSLFSRATPAFIALTVAEETIGSSSDNFETARPQRDEAEAKSKRRAESTVRVLDQATKTVLTNAIVDVSSTDGTKWIAFGQFREGSQAILDYPPGTFQLLRLTAVAPGYAPRSSIFAPQQDGLFASELDLALDRGETIGGLVQNGEEQPIPGVKVMVRTSVRDENNRPIAVDHPAVLTDQNGKWTMSGFPFGGLLQISLEHPRYERRVIQPESGNLETKTLLAELLSRDARLLMRPGFFVRGTITDPLAQPIAGAELIWGKANLAWTNDTRTRSAADGSFEFMALEREPLTVAVLAAGYAPRLFNVVAGRDLKPFSVALDKAKPLRGRVVDPEGEGIEGVTVTVDQWQQTRCLKWTTQTDKEGRFRWETPPTSAVELGFNRVGYKPRRRQAITVPNEEWLLQLAPASDAASRRTRPEKVLF